MRVQRANELLKRPDLPAKDRLKVARLKALDQAGVELRRKFPKLDKEGAA